MCRTQWLHGFGGPTGLNYPSLYPLMDRMNLEPDEWDALLEDIQAMEDEALATMAEQREQQTTGVRVTPFFMARRHV